MLLVGVTGSGPAAAGIVTARLPEARVELVSTQLAGGPSNSESAARTEISDDGRWVLFGSDGAGLDPKVPTNPGVTLPYLRDRRTGSIRMVATDSNGRVPDLTIHPGEFVPNINASLSGDGRWLVMDNVPRDLLPPWVATQPRPDITGRQYFVIKDLVTGVARPVRFPRVAIDGGFMQSTGTARLISRDGRVIAVSVVVARKWGNEVVGSSLGFTYDRITQRWRQLFGPTDPNIEGGAGVRQFSGDGRWLIYSTLLATDPFPQQFHFQLVDLRTLATRTLPVGSAPVLSGDGRRIFTTEGPEFPAKRLTIRVLDTTTLRVLASRTVTDGKRVIASDGAGRRLLVNVPEPNGDIAIPLPGQLYLWDWAADTQTRVTRGLDGGRARGGSAGAEDRTVSADGTVVAFSSKAWNLVPGDRYDPFLSWDTFTAVIPATPVPSGARVHATG